MDFLKHNSLRRSIAILVGIFSLSPLRVFGIEECESLDIGLEIMIDGTTEVSGLTEYVTIIYQFIVGAITIVAAVAIMYWGFRWITAAGNQTIIGSAKEGVVSALIGLVIGLTSYLILFMINASLVSFPSICATGIAFQDFGSNWDTCTVSTYKNSRECSTYDYCKSALGCSCQSVLGSLAFYCQPQAVNELGEGVQCSQDSNCISTLTCAGGSALYAGKCTQLNVNTPCDSDPNICLPPLECLDSHNGTKKCATVTGRSEGQYCEDNNECQSLTCNRQANVCMAGTENEFCVDNESCSWGFFCDSNACSGTAGNFDCCKSKSVNSSCDKKNGCPGTLHCVDTEGFGDTCQSGAEGALCDNDSHCTTAGAKYCVDNDGELNESSCTDGSDRDPCDVDGECTSQSCFDNICTAFGSGEGAFCSSDSDCTAAAPHCVRKKCYDGSSRDYCEDFTDCNDMSCIDNQCSSVTIF